jgi:hypothetical protein
LLVVILVVILVVVLVVILVVILVVVLVVVLVVILVVVLVVILVVILVVVLVVILVVVLVVLPFLSSLLHFCCLLYSLFFHEIYKSNCNLVQGELFKYTVIPLYKSGMRSWKSGLKSKKRKSKLIGYCNLSYFCYKIFHFFSNLAHLYL